MTTNSHHMALDPCLLFRTVVGHTGTVEVDHTNGNEDQQDTQSGKAANGDNAYGEKEGSVGVSRPYFASYEVDDWLPSHSEVDTAHIEAEGTRLVVPLV